MKKKIISAVILACLLTACGNNVTKNDVTESSAKTEVPSVAEKKSSPESSAESVAESVQEETESSYAENIEDIVEEMNEEAEEEKGLLTSAEDIHLTDADGWETNYSFEYGGETYSAVYTPDNWKIIDSYRIINTNDMKIICRALIEVNPIHGSDMQSYRTAEDLAYEWTQHNIAYELLPEDSEWKSHAKDVDLNPEDQDKGLYELFLSRTGEQGGDLYDQLVRGAESSE